MAERTAAPEREQWTGQYGFILAAVGSAVGLGNIWRFPGVAYENGGGAFLVPYLVALLTAGVPILLLDYSLGHRFRGSAPAVFRRLGKGFEPLGWFQVAISFIIATYYTVIVVWAIRYIGFSVDMAWGEDPAAFFTGDFLRYSGAGLSTDYVGGIFWPMLVLWLVVLAVLALGVQRGLERANRIFIPLLAVLFLIMVVRALFLEGAADGLTAFFTPNWEALGDPNVWIAAYSQIFFSLSIAFGIMITYSSYLKRRSNVAPTGYVVAFANSSFELLAGIGVFATLGFMAAQQGVAVGELENLTGPMLSFATFPQIVSMMPGGPIFGILFFTSLALAGFTSLISILQVVSAAFQEKFGLSRVQVSLLIGGLAAVISLALYSSTSGLAVLDTVDKYTNEVGVVLSAIATCVIVTLGARRLPELRAHLNAVSTGHVGRWWSVLVGAIVPIALTVMLVTSLSTLLGERYEDYPLAFLNIAGWGTLALMAVAALVYTLIPWRRPVDDFTPEPLSASQEARR
ncbi:neurotransmitter:Na+ symporter, NSS family [Georgenia satyanarayanai]|uniref:Neurotransmitter:Na+ symporter, NSS family n=1 Tax=Georgenia satyanarayanai TaxID=860221 RepID=A0A2Y9A621_9MICO|nr:sodium-dependent transporter [Georgenia satyanarayanai]PYG01137.1 NSS family neurotransmitter:Na+ symporter [Georgenia satyanarayanai]SSA39376.1 neurotransmitter:Na+ symporter, NSS family [Georgenia satyanarayanai]